MIVEVSTVFVWDRKHAINAALLGSLTSLQKERSSVCGTEKTSRMFANFWVMVATMICGSSSWSTTFVAAALEG